MIGFFLILIVIFLGTVIYQSLSFYYARKLIKIGVQRDCGWYEKIGHQLMDPALLTVEKPQQDTKSKAENFWENGEETEVRSYDGLKLIGRMFRLSTGEKWVVCVHDYRSDGQKDMSYIGKKYVEKGFNVLIPDLRAHGKSEGKIIGMGWLDRLDLMCWINYLLKIHPQASIILHGSSMGATAIMMASGEKLPDAVRGFILDSGFVSVYAQFRYMLSKLTFLPKKAIMRYANRYAKKYAGYSLKQASATRQLGSNHLPLLIIYGEKDRFVPVSTAYTIQHATAGEASLFLVSKAQHLETAVKDPKRYWSMVFSFIDQRIELKE
ncbi:alpha/beta hydrolase [Enterococcus ratti]|uniref:Serine aminopeptidase S33 domain-containing protein n=1 Tax=Enterococcus ratti TaxID=150033 RepID=A0A1L8WCA8_9ENTE|nr:alpha/beta fold hydrolase [Enterococcus ratti]OJG78659.1 hypothetical protein RV14_GL001121 [Enterococcus ratti]